MVETLTPDVYVVEVAAGPRPIQAVGTRTAGFIGVAPKADANRGARHGHQQLAPVHPDLHRRERARARRSRTRCSASSRTAGAAASSSTSAEATGVDAGLTALALEDEIAIVAAPGYDDVASYEAILTHCEDLKDRVAILDGPLQVDDLGKLTDGDHRASPRAAADEGAPTTPPDGKAGLRPRVSPGGYGAFYFPGITIRDPLGGGLVDVAPSGHIAGVWARNDATRGVHKAPANEPIRGALNVTQRLTVRPSRAPSTRTASTASAISPGKASGSGARGRSPTRPTSGATSTSGACST